MLSVLENSRPPSFKHAPINTASALYCRSSCAWLIDYTQVISVNVTVNGVVDSRTNALLLTLNRANKNAVNEIEVTAITEGKRSGKGGEGGLGWNLSDQCFGRV